MKHALLLLFALGSTHAVIAQQSPTVSSWISSHPNVYVMSDSNYWKMSADRRDQLEGQIIVYSGEIKLEQLQAFDELKSVAESFNSVGKTSESEEIKNWLGQNSDVKIIRRSQFDSMTETDQTLYQEIQALILVGEEITVQDVRNY